MDMLLKWSILLFKVQVYLYSPVSLHDQNSQIKVTSIKLGFIDRRVDFQNCYSWAFLVYGQQFPRYRPIFKIAISGHETWQVTKVPEDPHSYLSNPGGQNWVYFRSTGSGFWDMGQFSNWHIWAWNLASGQSSRSCTYTHIYWNFCSHRVPC